jgi:predicted dinucleotide-binding enzyme
MTKVAIIGIGNMGKGLASRLAGKVDLTLGSNNHSASAEFAATLKGGATVLSQEEAAASADIVVLAQPFAAALEFVRNAKLAGKVVVDITNPVKPDYSGLAFGHTTSAAEQLQEAAPEAHVVKAYNTIFAGLFARPVTETADIPVFIAGNNEQAVSSVEALVRQSGFDAEKAGGLDAARLIEPLGMLNIRFAYGLGRGTNIAPSWSKIAA